MKNQSSNSIISSSTFNSSKLNKTSNSIRNLNSSNDEDNYFSIINFKQFLKNDYKKKTYFTFIKEMSNGTIIVGGPKDIMFFYNKNFEFIKHISFEIPSDSDKIEIMKSSHQERKLKFFKKTQNIFETKFSEENDNMIEINDCSLYALIQYRINFDNHNKIRMSEPIQLLLPSTGYFEINVLGYDEYVVFGPKGIFHFRESPYNLNKFSEKELGKYNKNKTDFKAGIKINDNYIALISNKVTKPNGEDILAIYNTKKKDITKKIVASFVSEVNGMELIEIEIKKENKKFLLCGCKKYISGQKNGIMIIDADIKENENLKNKFCDTDDFEVNCFCQINIKNNNDYFIKTNYFFVGGFDNERRCGMIKLYRINYDNKNNLENFDIEFLQDIHVDISNEFQVFGGAINTIIQSKTNGKLLINCLDGYIYCFSEPNIDFYLECEENDNVNDQGFTNY